MLNNKSVIITGASGGIGSGLVETFLKQGCSIVATSLGATQSLKPSPGLIPIDGDIGSYDTALKVAGTAIRNFGTIDVLVTNAGILYMKPFTEFTRKDFDVLVSVNLLGFIYITQLAVQQMLKQKSGCIVSITASLADNPNAGVNASVSMLTKGGLNTIIQSLAIEYAKENIRFNAVAPGVVDTPMHKADSIEKLKSRQPTGRITSVKDISEAVLYLAQAEQVTGEILHVDGGAHIGKW